MMIMGFFIVVTGWALQTVGSIASNIRSSGTLLDAEAVFQLAGFISIIVGLSILAIGFFRFARRVERHISSHTWATKSKLTLRPGLIREKRTSLRTVTA